VEKAARHSSLLADDRCAVREKDGVGGGGKGLTCEPWLAIRPGKVSRKALLCELKARSLAALPLPFFVRFPPTSGAWMA
jgi:hypothetical protein